jgi:hypothetical protein
MTDTGGIHSNLDGQQPELQVISNKKATLHRVAFLLLLHQCYLDL